MDKTIELLKALAGWIARNGVSPVPFVGQAGYRFHNPPAPQLEVCYLTAGACPDLRIGDRAHPVSAGQVTVHSVARGNYSGNHESMRSWCLFLDCAGDSELSALLDCPPGLIPIGNGTALTDTFSRLTRLAYQLGRGPHGYFDPRPLYHPDDAADQPGAACMLKGLALELMGQLLEEAQPRFRHGELGSSTVRQVVQLLRLEYQQPELGLPGLARAVSLTPNHLGKLFRREMGVSPMQYLQRLRLEHARQLLLRTDLRVNEVARLVGYRDALYFSRLFRREVGSSPRLFRETSGARP